MHNSATQGNIVFIIIAFALIFAMAVIISFIIYRYQQKQNIYFKELENLKAVHENLLLQSQIEIQEQTFQNISREIHDNIGQKLTLAKLHLNTLNFNDRNNLGVKITDTVHIIGEAINDLSDISRSMSSDIILGNGLIKALEFETAQLMKSGLYTINMSVAGNCIFLDSHTELILFRIVQEALNNIIKHAQATIINLQLNYSNDLLILEITDNGRGFDTNNEIRPGTGLINMKKRANLLHGKFSLFSRPDMGTQLKIEINIHEHSSKL